MAKRLKLCKVHLFSTLPIKGKNGNGKRQPKKGNGKLGRKNGQRENWATEKFGIGKKDNIYVTAEKWQPEIWATEKREMLNKN